MARDFTRGGAFSNINVAEIDKGLDVGATVWSTDKVNALLENYAAGTVDIRGYKGSPFFMNDLNLRKSKLQFQYTKNEMRELRRCAKDPVYFARYYCTLFTEEGYIKVNLRDYQREMIGAMLDERMVIMMCSRQIGKCISFNTRMRIYNRETNSMRDVPVYNIWYNILKKNNALTVFARIKYKLYKLYDLLSASHAYK